VKRKKSLKPGIQGRTQTTAPVEPVHPKVRAVAFRIGDTVYEGDPKGSHLTLYTYLLRKKRVPAHMLDFWTSDERNHGFVTENGEFLDRREAFRQFGAARSQDLQAKGIFTTARPVSLWSSPRASPISAFPTESPH
jgi:hypothetical protein